ncbi:transposable element, partial [Pseudoloma neurophilia]
MKWGPEQQNCLDKVIKEIQENVELKYPDINKPFILETDASQNGIGAVLKQEHGIIGFFSKKLSNTETNYSIVGKEFLAIILSLKHFRKIVSGCEITIKTDNKNICNYKKIESNRISRWSWISEDFNVKIEHVSASKNPVADTLSRLMLTQQIPIKNQSTQEWNKIDRHLSEFAALSEDERASLLSTFLMKLHTKLGHPGSQCLFKLLADLQINLT